jgi:IclR family pca regulon transcriptional regulator
MRNQVSRSETKRTKRTQGATRARYLIQSLAQGLQVLESFGSAPRGLTLMDLSRSLGLGKATAFRYLSTLESLGFIEIDPDTRRYHPAVKLLRLGGAFLAGLAIPDVAAPFLEKLSSRLGESVNLAVLDETEVVYVARVAGNRILSTNLGVGSRLPAHCTSMGKVLLAHLSEDEQRRIIAKIDFKRATPMSVASAKRLREVLALVRRQGYAINDQELDLGLRSCAAPVFRRDGAAIAAVNVSVAASHATCDALQREYVPAVVETALQITEMLKARY